MFQALTSIPIVHGVGNQVARSPHPRHHHTNGSKTTYTTQLTVRLKVDSGQASEMALLFMEQMLKGLVLIKEYPGTWQKSNQL